MTLSELLNYTRRYVLRDRAIPPIWPDELIVSYLNEGQQRAAARTHAFVVSEREVPLSADQALYPLDPDIVQVYSATIVGYFEKLVPLTETWTPALSMSRRPSHFNTDRETQSITFYPTPDVDYTAVLRVAHLPVTLTLDDIDTEIDLKPQYQLALADWAAYRCFGNDDADGRNDGAAKTAYERFHATINEFKRDEYKLRTGHGMRAHGDRVK